MKITVTTIAEQGLGEAIDHSLDMGVDQLARVHIELANGAEIVITPFKEDITVRAIATGRILLLPEADNVIRIIVPNNPTPQSA